MSIQFGLRQNWRQFWLLVFINALVGGMIGLERTLLPEIARSEFHISSTSVVLLFIVTFGIFKSVSNYLAGILADLYGRKKLLFLGWLIGIPVPFMLMYAPDWNWVIAANILLGVNQGLAWSSTIVMKIDLVGQKDRGFAIGLNEFAGYGALALVAFATGAIAEVYGLRPYPFLLGIGLVMSGALLTLLFVSDTDRHVAKECREGSNPLILKRIFRQTTWSHKNLGTVTQAGLVNNLNDAMIWGTLPIILAQRGFSLADIGVVSASYPFVWGVMQIFTGKLADIFCKKDLLFWGMFLQGIAILMLVLATAIGHFIAVSVFLGIGTAVVYPTFLSSIAEHTHPQQRATSLGIFRFWRDLGYVIGAVITGIFSDLIGIEFSIITVAAVTIASSLIILFRMRCSQPLKRFLYRPHSA